MNNFTQMLLRKIESDLDKARYDVFEIGEIDIQTVECGRVMFMVESVAISEMLSGHQGLRLGYEFNSKEGRLKGHTILAQKLLSIRGETPDEIMKCSNRVYSLISHSLDDLKRRLAKQLFDEADEKIQLMEAQQ